MVKAASPAGQITMALDSRPAALYMLGKPDMSKHNQGNLLHLMFSFFSPVSFDCILTQLEVDYELDEKLVGTFYSISCLRNIYWESHGDLLD